MPPNSFSLVIPISSATRSLMRSFRKATRRKKRALCGVEVALHRARVFITGRIACRKTETIDVPAIVREVFRTAGYSGAAIRVPKNCG